MLHAMKRVVPLIFTVVIFSCGTGSTNKPETIDLSKNADSSITESVDNDNTNRQVRTDTIILYENRIDRITLPFRKVEMLTELKKEFAGFTVTKEIGQQDGPDFPLYSIKERDNEICFFGMDSEDTLKLNEVYIKQAIVKDQYGLKVGDGYQKIKTVRSKNTKTYTDLHQHTFVYFDNSNIMYEISGSVFLPDTVDFENLKFTEEQIKDWTIEYLIWRE
jgi:hypothetical protein